MSRAQVAVEYNPLPRAEAPAPDAEAPGDEAAPAPDPACVFARFLAENVPARAVSLRGDGLGDGGARAVADALARNTWVLALNLFDNGIGDAGGAAVVGAARYNTMLKTLSLSNNACGDGTAAAAAATLVGGPVDDAAKAAHEAALGRLADLNKAIASGKKPKAKPGELRPPARERARARAAAARDVARGARFPDRGAAAQAPAERRGGAAARAARVGRRRGLRAGEQGPRDPQPLEQQDQRRRRARGPRGLLARGSGAARGARARATRARDAGEPVDGLDFKLAAAVREVNLTRNGIDDDVGVELARVSEDKVVL